MSSSLKNIKISDSYPRLVQQVDGIFYDGAGNRIQGIGGPQGTRGPQGIGSGSLGAQGPQGFQGMPGNTGSGVQGFQGPTGNNGTDGPQGFQGVTGITGATGSPGIGSSSVWNASEEPEVPGNFWVVEPAPGPGQASIQINVIDSYGNDQTGMLTTISGLTPASIPTIFTITNGTSTLSILVTSSAPAALVGTWLITGNIITQNTLNGPALYAVSYSVTGPITSPLNFVQGSQIESIPDSSGDNLSASTMVLKPDSSLSTDQYIVLDPTGGVPNHIHIRAGGDIDSSTTDLFIGGEDNNLKVSDVTNTVEINSFKINNIDSQAFPIGIPFTSANWFTDTSYYIEINNPFSFLYDVLSTFAYPSTLSILYDDGTATHLLEINVTDVNTANYPTSVILTVAEIPPLEPTTVIQFNFVINEALLSKVSAIANNGNVNIWTGNISNQQVWSFGATGNLTFPNGSIQTTAYPGIPAFISSGNSAPGSAVVANPTNVNINFSDGGSGAWSFDPTSITLKNLSMIRAGQYSILTEGGISRVCSIGYEDLWQGGIRYVFDTNGLIREATNCFSFIPDSSFNYSKRFKVGSRWILDNGDLYECTYDGSGISENAEWKFVPKTNYKVFTAIVNQLGSSNPGVLNTGDNLTPGYSYTINENGYPPTEYDFTNVGAPNNDFGTSFIATGTTPTWGYGVRLNYNDGSPRVIILENTIGNIWFKYLQEGSYECKSNDLFSLNKTIISMDAYGQDGNPACNISHKYLSIDRFRIETWKNMLVDEALINTRLEIKVYY